MYLNNSIILQVKCTAIGSFYVLIVWKMNPWEVAATRIKFKSAFATCTMISTFFTTSSQYSFTLKNPCGWILLLWRNFCHSLRKPSRQKFKNLFACEFTAQECRDESEISNNRFKNGILGGSLDMAWLFYTDLIIRWFYVTLGLCQCYCNNLLLYSFALI